MQMRQCKECNFMNTGFLRAQKFLGARANFTLRPT